jgi:hypothetical protein
MGQSAQNDEENDGQQTREPTAANHARLHYPQ